MNEWSEFASALLTFFVLHGVPVRPPVKTRIIERIGARWFTLAYSAISLAALGWLIVAASRAPYVELWPPTSWQHGATLGVMFGACLMLAFALGRPNPFSFGGTADSDFDPARAGIIRLIRHPLLLALFLWSSAHVLPNGNLAHVVLFGLFAGFSLFGMHLINRRKRRQLGPARYTALLSRMRQAALIPSFADDRPFIRATAATGLFAALVWLHPYVLGVSPLAVFY